MDWGRGVGGWMFSGWIPGWGDLQEVMPLYLQSSVPELDPGSSAACPHRPRYREAPSTKTRSVRCRGLPPFRSPSPLRGRKNRRSKNKPISSPVRGRGTAATAVVEGASR